MTLLIALLTFILVVTCLFLILLVLVQLPKKEAGAGLAFGGGATDALFGAGGGNALTKMTKYTATAFLGLALLLTVLNTQRHHSSSRNLERALSGKSVPGGAPLATPPSTPATATPQATTPANTQPQPGAASGPLQTQPLQLNPQPAGQTPTLNLQPANTPANTVPQQPANIAPAEGATPANPAPATETKAQP